MSIDSYLDTDGIMYRSLQEKTETLRQMNNNPSYRNICDVIINIRSLLPTDVLSKYDPIFKWIIDDSYYRAPEVYGDSWFSLGQLLETISTKHHDSVPIEELKKCFSGSK